MREGADVDVLLHIAEGMDLICWNARFLKVAGWMFGESPESNEAQGPFCPAISLT